MTGGVFNILCNVTGIILDGLVLDLGLGRFTIAMGIVSEQILRTLRGNGLMFRYQYTYRYGRYRYGIDYLIIYNILQQILSDKLLLIFKWTHH